MASRGWIIKTERFRIGFLVCSRVVRVVKWLRDVCLIKHYTKYIQVILEQWKLSFIFSLIDSRYGVMVVHSSLAPDSHSTPSLRSNDDQRGIPFHTFVPYSTCRIYGNQLGGANAPDALSLLPPLKDILVALEECTWRRH